MRSSRYYASGVDPSSHLDSHSSDSRYTNSGSSSLLTNSSRATHWPGRRNTVRRSADHNRQGQAYGLPTAGVPHNSSPFQPDCCSNLHSAKSNLCSISAAISNFSRLETSEIKAEVLRTQVTPSSQSEEGRLGAYPCPLQSYRPTCSSKDTATARVAAT